MTRDLSRFRSRIHPTIRTDGLGVGTVGVHVPTTDWSALVARFGDQVKVTYVLNDEGGVQAVERVDLEAYK